MSIKSLLQLILFLLIILIIGGIYYVYFFSKNQSDTINLDTKIYKIEDKIEVIDLSKFKVDIIDDEDSIHINSDSNKKNNSKEKVLIIMDNDTILNIKK